jgi:hypothetical protein
MCNRLYFGLLLHFMLFFFLALLHYFWIPLYKIPRSATDQRQVFRGESNKKKDMLFAVKRSCALHCHTGLDVIMKDGRRYRVKGKYHKKSMEIYELHGGHDSSSKPKVVAKVMH